MTISNAVCDRMFKRALTEVPPSCKTRSILQRELKKIVCGMFDSSLHYYFSVCVASMTAENRRTILFRDVPMVESTVDYEDLSVPRAGVYITLKSLATDASTVSGLVTPDGITSIRMSSAILRPITDLVVNATMLKLRQFLMQACEFKDDNDGANHGIGGSTAIVHTKPHVPCVVDAVIPQHAKPIKVPKRSRRKQPVSRRQSESLDSMDTLPFTQDVNFDVFDVDQCTLDLSPLPVLKRSTSVYH